LSGGVGGCVGSKLPIPGGGVIGAAVIGAGEEGNINLPSGLGFENCGICIPGIPELNLEGPPIKPLKSREFIMFRKFLD
jgi:hypothetical protein